ncbi:alpha/beta fold hydrolase [Amnibacterium endophyticum]|uniref:Alpha/beta fold hydrolase n=1 Tax=Amnibacterium endophyticum TaxID=2109337 RepID=A0ABW4LG76_9MICO
MSEAIEPIEVDTPAGRVAVHALGAGRPTVLWHGLYADGASWGYVLPALLPGRRLLVVDAPGWGRSGRLAPDAGWAEVVTAAADVIRQLAPGEVADWVGAGWGGRVGIALAADAPRLVRSVVAAMADPAPMGPAERRRTRRVLAGLAALGPVGGVGRAIVREQLSAPSAAEPQTVGAVLDALLLAGRVGAARSALRFDVRRPDLTGLLPRIAAPLLLVGGDAASPWPLADAERAAALAPFARAGAVPGSRTLVPLDRPGPLTAVVGEFWAGLDD